VFVVKEGERDGKLGLVRDGKSEDFDLVVTKGRGVPLCRACCFHPSFAPPEKPGK
jgi:hypothetical protein